MKQTALIIGGSSGLGLELGKLLTSDYQVFVTGRKNPKEEGLEFCFLELDSNLLYSDINIMLAGLPKIDLLIYAAGFFQEGTIAQLSVADIEKMSRVGLLAPSFLLQCILGKQKSLSGFIAITSTSQWTPRKLEPVYTAVKAGLGMLAHSVSFDEAFEKVLVVGPSGMNTHFWDSAGRDVPAMLHPFWVAQQIVDLYSNDNFKYRFARILRDPQRVETTETRL